MTTGNEMQVLGPPGTGKTTFLARQVAAAAEHYGAERVVVTSLTRAAAAEIAGRDLPVPRDHVGTLHALAYRQLGRPKIAETIASQFNAAYPAYAVSAEHDASPERDRPDGAASGQPGDGAAEQVALYRHRRIPREAWNAEALAWDTRWQEFKADTGTIDFTDMIEMAFRDVDTAPDDPDAILADEVQDYSRLELALVRKWGARARTLVIAGDADQAIYEWRGADPRVFLDHDPSVRRVLEQSYRVPRAVHAAATRWIRQISTRIDAAYRPRDDDGVVESSSARWSYPEDIIDDLTDRADAGETCMVLASCDYMIGPLVAVLRQTGTPFANPWRRTNGAWNPLAGRRGAVTMAQRVLAFLRPEVDGRWWGAEDLRRWTEPLRADGVLRRGAKAAIERLGTDASEEVGLDRVAAWLEEDAIGPATDVDLAWWQSHLLQARESSARFPIQVYRKRGAGALTEPPRVYVGTIHSFKGAEADNVYLFPDLSQSGYRAYLAEPDPTIRLFYVAMTRARRRLVICSRSGPLAVDIG